MRKLRSIIALTSVAAVMACQTVAASSSVTRGVEVVPVLASQSSTSGAPSQTQSQSQSRTTTATSSAASSSKRTWIIAGVIAAAALVVLVIALSMDGSSGGVY